MSDSKIRREGAGAVGFGSNGPRRLGRSDHPKLQLDPSRSTESGGPKRRGTFGPRERANETRPSNTNQTVHKRRRSRSSGRFDRTRGRSKGHRGGPNELREDPTEEIKKGRSKGGYFKMRRSKDRGPKENSREVLREKEEEEVK